MKKVLKFSAVLLALPLIASCKPGLKAKGQGLSEGEFYQTLKRVQSESKFAKADLIASYVLTEKAQSRTVTTTSIGKTRISKVKEVSKENNTFKYDSKNHTFEMERKSSTNKTTSGKTSSGSTHSNNHQDKIYQAAEIEGKTYSVTVNERNKTFEKDAILEDGAIEKLMDKKAKTELGYQLADFPEKSDLEPTSKLYNKDKVFTVETKIDTKEDDKVGEVVYAVRTIKSEEIYQLDLTEGKMSYTYYIKAKITTEYKQAVDGHCEGEVVVKESEQKDVIKVKEKKVTVKPVSISKYGETGKTL